MIKIIEIPGAAMDVIRYSGAITSHETARSVIDWILKENKGRGGHRGTITISFFNHALRDPIELTYDHDTLYGIIPKDVSGYTAVDISAKHWGRSMTFNYEVYVMDPNSKEYSGVRSLEDDDDWED
ncbi:MAG: hypothetical protein NC548_39830 [Lachnospiraceae bacterium]|nr:hypothetical protein [Lachnospiraceae bacterium]